MNRFVKTFSLSACAASLAFLAGWHAGQPETQNPYEGMTQDQIMQAWMGAAMPGKHHEHLAQYAGTWETASRMWMEPGTEPVEQSPGKATSEMILDGRFLKQHYSGDFDGMPFTGHGLVGYNNITGQFESSWIDTMGTMIMFSTGSGTAKEITFETSFKEPVKKMTIRTKMVYTLTSPDSYTLTMYMAYPGQELWKHFEMDHTRVN